MSRSAGFGNPESHKPLAIEGCRAEKTSELDRGGCNR
jgi:hypothetical protein